MVTCTTCGPSVHGSSTQISLQINGGHGNFYSTELSTVRFHFTLPLGGRRPS
uniref:Uncharacterized protein n=1 Tax=Arundo donax TaxID=35708 RepID=A0A0A8ZSX1_ARUDO